MDLEKNQCSKPMNYFATKRSATLYAEGRPDFHGICVQRIQQHINLDKTGTRVLDIACGTGLSTKALLAVADDVYGTDVSAAMLDHAACSEQICYRRASADQQPFADAFFDLITVCSGVHWFDTDPFLAEAKRLLKPGGWLVLYDNFFMAVMENNPGFNSWHRQVYLKQFPAPARNDNYDWSAPNLESKQFVPVFEESFTNGVAFSLNDLVCYFMSQSNTIAAVDAGKSTDGAVRSWLQNELIPFFSDTAATPLFTFGNQIRYLQTI
jgi:ubiquinone/menaquinone biosynthesis C-methylase UbiE